MIRHLLWKLGYYDKLMVKWQYAGETEWHGPFIELVRRGRSAPYRGRSENRTTIAKVRVVDRRKWRAW